MNWIFERRLGLVGVLLLCAAFPLVEACETVVSRRAWCSKREDSCVLETRMRLGNERRTVLPLSALSTVEVREWRRAYDVVVTVEGRRYLLDSFEAEHLARARARQFEAYLTSETEEELVW